jgi:DNA-binding IscR family transcriptional regulator
MVEKLLLSLRRAGLVAASRGRSGGYRLQIDPQELYLQAVLNAVGGWRQTTATTPEGEEPGGPTAQAGDQMELQLQRRLLKAMQKELANLSLAELLYDQRSWEAALDPEKGLMLG